MDNLASLEQELTSISGVEGAEVAVGEAGVTGVKVRLEADADADGVGQAVQEVMTRHGVRARLDDSPPAPPGVPARVVTLADHQEDVAPPLHPITDASLAGLAVAEGPSGLEVTATSGDGRSVTQRSRGGDTAIAEAVAMATAELYGVPGTELVEYRRDSIGDTDVVTVLLDTPNSGRLAGAATVGAGFPFAIAKAVWAALGA